jgi:hypothetical protein
MMEFSEISRRSRGPALRLGALLAAGLAALLALACDPAGRGLSKPRGSVLWITPDAGPVETADLETLEPLGVGEVFQQVGELTWQGAEPVVTPAWTEAAALRHTAVTLVLAGEAPPPEADAEAAAEALAGELRRLELEAQGRGLAPVGLHLDLGLGTAGAEPLAGLLAELGGRVEPPMLLSATLGTEALSDPAAERVAAAADFLVVFLYGQRSWTSEDPQAWETAAVEKGLERLEALGADYLLGAATLGWAIRRDRRGAFAAATTDASLRRLLDAPGMETALGLSLEAGERQVYTFRARAPTRVLGWRLGEAEEVRVVAPTSGHLRRLLGRLAGLELPHRLGQAWFRPPRPEEGLSLSLTNLAGALAPRQPVPGIEARVEPAERRGRAPAVRVTVTNPGGEPTEIARVETNYVELTARRGSFRQVDAGGFERYDLLDSATGERSLSRPGTLRLYTSYLAPGESLTSGRITLAGARGEADVAVGGKFLFPDGTTVEVAPTPAGAEPTPGAGSSR